VGAGEVMPVFFGVVILHFGTAFGILFLEALTGNGIAFFLPFYPSA
jgi:hypothetical protein